VTSSDEMIALGKKLAPSLSGIVCLRGDLGAGKTTLAKGIISHLTGTDPSLILSPTFNIVNQYSSISHFDCYRLADEREFFARGLEEYLDSSFLSLIEWDEKVCKALPRKKTIISISILPNDERSVSVDYEAD
jgi:tRNA threonylcarbamoyladenosine biosynthesis protein TsaE